MIKATTVKFVETQTAKISAGMDKGRIGCDDFRGRILWRGKRPDMLCVPMDFNPLQCLLKW